MKQKLSHLKLIFVLAIFAVILNLYWAQGAVALQFLATNNHINATSHIDIFEDVERQYSAEHLTQTKFNTLFEPLTGEKASFGFSPSAWWVRLNVSNPDNKEQMPVLVLDYPLLDYVDVWVISGTDIVSHWQTGNQRPFNTRPAAHREFLFPLSLKPEEDQLIYMRVHSEGPINIGLKLYTEKALLERVELEYLALGAYFGSFFLLAIAVLLLYILDRRPAFLFYFMYILSYSSYMMAFNGLAFQYLWPDYPVVGQTGRTLLLISALFFLLQFSSSLLSIKNTAPMAQKLVYLLQALLVANLVLLPFVGYGMVIMPIAVITLFAMLLVISMGIIAQFQGEMAARYYLLAWSVFLIGTLTYIFKVFGWLPHNFITHYGFQIGSFFEFVFLSVALGVRIRELKHLSNTDPLTGLANRRSFNLALAEAFAMSNKPGEALSLLVIDIDHFKGFNDTHGHATGDQALKELARVLKDQVRRPSLACRYGGEEFTVLLPKTDITRASLLAEELRVRVTRESSYEAVTISVGVVSTTSMRFSDMIEFFAAGDQALYDAKHAGRNQIATYDPSRAKTDLTHSLRTAAQLELIN